MISVVRAGAQTEEQRTLNKFHIFYIIKPIGAFVFIMKDFQQSKSPQTTEYSKPISNKKENFYNKNEINVEKSASDLANDEYLRSIGQTENKNISMNNNMNKYKFVTIAVICFTVGFFVSNVIDTGRILPKEKNDSGEAEKVENEKTETKNAGGEEKAFNLANNINASVSVSDQPFGGTIFISNFSTNKTSWVAVYEDNNGEPGNILGARVFDAGDWSGEIELLRETIGDSKYYLKIHIDNGDRLFDYKKDTAVKNPITKKEIIESFRTTSGMPR